LLIVPAIVAIFATEQKKASAIGRQPMTAASKSSRLA